jgi:hypothetical protein
VCKVKTGFKSPVQLRAWLTALMGAQRAGSPGASIACLCSESPCHTFLPGVCSSGGHISREDNKGPFPWPLSLVPLLVVAKRSCPLQIAPRLGHFSPFPAASLAFRVARVMGPIRALLWLSGSTKAHLG